MATMKAVRAHQYGGPEVLKLEDVPAPRPSDDEVVVRVLAAGVNASDLKMVAGAFNSALPLTPGRDFAGEVITAGDWQGKQVWGSGAGFGVTHQGSHAEYIVIPKSWLSEAPSELSAVEAAAVGVPYVTAWSTLVIAARLQPGETVLITGANGAVGRAAGQIARLRKATVIGADITLPSAGADAYIDTRTQDLPREVMCLTEGRGVDVTLDTVGGALFESALKSLARDGRHLVITSVGERRVGFDLVDFYHNRQQLIGVDTAKLTGIEIAEILDQLRPAFDSKALRPPSIDIVPLGQAGTAYAAVSARRSSARQVLTPD